MRRQYGFVNIILQYIAEGFHLLIIVEQNIRETSALTDFADAVKHGHALKCLHIKMLALNKSTSIPLRTRMPYTICNHIRDV